MAITGQPNAAHAVATAYFDALARRDLAAVRALWAPDGVGHVAGLPDLVGGEEVGLFVGAMLDAFPDLELTVLATTVQDGRAAVQWRAEGTFAGEPYDGLEPTGARVHVEGIDVLHVRDGRIVRNDAYVDGLDYARQLGVMPPRGTRAERTLNRTFNSRTRAARRVAAAPPRRVADGVWLLRGGLPRRTMNVFLVEDEGGGVTVFDAGIRAMTREVAAFGARLGGINRVVLGHAHADHRGTAPGLAAPVFCHPLERADAEGDGGDHYFAYGRLNPVGRVAFPRLLARWDGGPVRIAGTLEEGDEVSGFRVVHLPGHAPGLIGLLRERDGVALTSDCFYTLDPQTTRHGPPRVPHAAFNLDTERARASIRKLADLRPAVAWPGHAGPVAGDVRATLRRAVDAG